MSDEPEQFYILRVERMTTSDEADAVPSWSAVVSEKNLDSIKMSEVGRLLTLQMEKAPLSGIRPMTEAEIAVWRNTQS